MNSSGSVVIKVGLHVQAINYVWYNCSLWEEIAFQISDIHFTDSVSTNNVSLQKPHLSNLDMYFIIRFI